MKLLVNELKNIDLYQTVTPEKNIQVQAIRLNLYKHNNPSGNLYLEIHDNNGELITTSESLSAIDISSENYFHGLIRFYISAQLKAETQYRVVLKSSGYTFSESNYFGWCNSFDLEIYPPSYEVTGTFQAPLALEIWGFNLK